VGLQVVAADEVSARDPGRVDHRREPVVERGRRARLRAPASRAPMRRRTAASSHPRAG